MAKASSVAELLNTAQDSLAACERCAGGLWKLMLQDPDSHFVDLTQCVDVLLTASQKSPHVSMCLKLFACFVSKTPADCETSTAVVEELLKHTCSHTSAADKAVRLQSCLLLQQMLANLPQHLGLEEESVLATLTESLVERLQDKQIAVRAAAVAALCELIDVDEDPYDALEPVTTLLECDRSKDVRAAVVSCLPLGPSTLPVLLKRARDVHPMVRKALVARLQGLSIKVLSIRQRASVLHTLLQDRDAGVAKAAGGLLAHWLNGPDCQGDPLTLLQLLDVETFTDAAACALESLISSNSIHPPAGHKHSHTSGSGGSSSRHQQPSVIAYVKAATAAAAGRDGGGGRQGGGGLVGLRALCQQQQEEEEEAGEGAGGAGGGRLLEPHEALLWRCLCEWLRSDAISRGMAAAATGGVRATVEAAVANERHEALESLLPETSDDLMRLVLRHTAAGPRARFAATQLLMVAAQCMEWTDASSRDSAAPLLQQLMGLDPTRDNYNNTLTAAAVGGGGGGVSGSMDVDGRVSKGRSIRRQKKSEGGGEEEGEESDAAEAEAAAAQGMQLAGNGGDGAFEGAVVSLVAALQGGPAAPGFMGAMLEGIAALAAAVGLLRKPVAAAAEGETGEQEVEQHHFLFTVGVADSSQVLQVLTYIRLLLQHTPMNSRLQLAQQQQQQQAVVMTGAGAAAGGGAGSISSSSSSAVSLESLWELLLLLALKGEHAAVRAAAVECVGLYTAACAPTSPRLLLSAVSLLGPLLSHSFEGVGESVRGAAVRALCDLGLLFGPAAIDAVLLRGGVGAGSVDGTGDEQTAAAAEGGDEGEGGASADSSSKSRSSASVATSNKGLLQLLIEQGEGLLAEAQAAGASTTTSKGRGGRASTKSRQQAAAASEDSTSSSGLSPAAAELMAVVAEALAKLLLHQRTWLRRYTNYTATLPNSSTAAADVEMMAQQQQQPLPPDSQQQQARLLQRGLALLLQLQFHPASAGVTQVCQRLSVFFDVFSAASIGNRLQLAAACVPAARQALHVTNTKKHPAPLLVKYVLQLLQHARLRDEQELADGVVPPAAPPPPRGLCGESFASVAHQMVSEVATVGPITVGVGHQPAKFKPYLAALLKVVCELPLAAQHTTSTSHHHNSGSGGADTSAAAAYSDLRVLQYMADDLSVRITDAVLLKDVAALQQHLQGLMLLLTTQTHHTAAGGGGAGRKGASASTAAGGGAVLQQEQLCDEAIEQLVRQVQGLSLVQLPALPDGLQQAAAAVSGGRGSVSVSTAGGRGSRSRSSSAATTSAAAAASKTSARRGRGRPPAAAAAATSRRAAAAAAESSSSSEGDDSSSSDDDADSSDVEQAAPAAATAAAAAKASTATRRRSSAAAAAAAKSAAAAAAASSDDQDLQSAAEEEDSEEFATAGESDDGDGDGADDGAVVGRGAAAAADRTGVSSRRRSAAASTAAGAVSEYSDSDDSSSSDDDDGDDSDASDEEQQEQEQQKGASAAAACGDGKGAGRKSSTGNNGAGSKTQKQGAGNSHLRGGARRQPLTPSAVVNSSGRQ